MPSQRYAGKPWWQMPLPTAPAQTWKYEPMHDKGVHGGLCQRAGCSNGDANWFNETNGKYYCNGCARTFNEVARRHGQPPLCELHPHAMPRGTASIARA